MWEAEPGESWWVWGQLRLCSEDQADLDYRGRTCHNQPTKQQQQQKIKMKISKKKSDYNCNLPV